jgi:hypothetical protein
VVEHGEADHSGEATTGKRHLRRVALLDGDLVRQRVAQTLAVALVQLEHAQPRRALGEHARGGAIARADLQHVLAKLDPRETPGQELALDRARPPARRADQCVRAVHVGSI